MEKYGYSFSFGPWNIQPGADPFGPPVRPAVEFEEKLRIASEIGYDMIQFHDNEVVPNIDEASPAEIRQQAREVRKLLDDYGLKANSIGPRLWEHPMGIDGSYTANDPAAFDYAIERTKKAIDIIFELGGDMLLLWYAREGTYLREAKDPVRAHHRILESINIYLEYNKDLRVTIEPKPNEPMDQAYIPTIGHALAIGQQSDDPARCGVLVESAHAVLAGLDPADEMAFALSFGKLWGVHLNDQNGMKFDQDRAFGTVNLRRAFDQVWVLDSNRFYELENCAIGVDTKALRTQSPETAAKHLRNSLNAFLRLVELVRSLDWDRVEELRRQRDYEELDWLIMTHLMG
ncbi:MAG TPA: TIM barrel protein [Aggregatilineales bacterium]|nr:TIM barrel protein [Aggregatilineales bacterium]HQA69046.1 TIM barrel protein [Aggregatilineales bacterium]